MRLHLLRAATRGFRVASGLAVPWPIAPGLAQDRSAAEDHGARSDGARLAAVLFELADAVDDQRGEIGRGHAARSHAVERTRGPRLSGIAPSSRKKCLGRDADERLAVEDCCKRRDARPMVSSSQRARPSRDSSARRSSFRSTSCGSTSRTTLVCSEDQKFSQRPRSAFWHLAKSLWKCSRNAG